MKKLLLSFAALIGLTTGAIAQTAELKISDAQKNISVNKTSYVLKDKKLVPSRRADVYSDWYNFTGVTFTYKIKNKPKKCPKALRP